MITGCLTVDPLETIDRLPKSLRLAIPDIIKKRLGCQTQSLLLENGKIQDYQFIQKNMSKIRVSENKM